MLSLGYNVEVNCHGEDWNVFLNRFEFEHASLAGISARRDPLNSIERNSPLQIIAAHVPSSLRRMPCLYSPHDSGGVVLHVCLTLRLPIRVCLAWCTRSPKLDCRRHLETSLMSQAWRVIAPGRKEATKSLGELHDALLSDSATELVPLLAGPLQVRRSVLIQFDSDTSKNSQLQPQKRGDHTRRKY